MDLQGVEEVSSEPIAGRGAGALGPLPQQPVDFPQLAPQGLAVRRPAVAVLGSRVLVSPETAAELKTAEDLLAEPRTDATI